MGTGKNTRDRALRVIENWVVAQRQIEGLIFSKERNDLAPALGQEEALAGLPNFGSYIPKACVIGLTARKSSSR